MVPSGHHFNERCLFFCFWLHCASLPFFLSALTLFLKFTHTHTPFNLSFFDEVLMDISEKYCIGGWEAVQASHSKQCLREEKMLCYINQHILYLDNGRNTPWKICISLVLLQQIDLKTYLSLLFVSSEIQTGTASHIAIRELIGLEKREYFGVWGFFFQDQLPFWSYFKMLSNRTATFGYDATQNLLKKTLICYKNINIWH